MLFQPLPCRRTNLSPVSGRRFDVRTGLHRFRERAVQPLAFLATLVLVTEAPNVLARRLQNGRADYSST